MKNEELRPGLFLQPFVVSQLVGSVIANIVVGTGLSATDFAVVSSLAVWEEATPSELARLLGMPPTTLSAVLKRLEERGLVERLRDNNDRRRHILALTDRGMESRNKAIERFPAWMTRVQAHLGTNSESILESMRQLEAALRAALADERSFHDIAEPT